jgi:hypothetical protein
MSEKSAIARHSLGDIRMMRARGEDLTLSDAPEAASLGEAFWESARVVAPAARRPSIRASTPMWWTESRRMAKGA